jgi:hypothetical protein
MDRVNHFFVSLLVLRCVEDVDSGRTFHLPSESTPEDSGGGTLYFPRSDARTRGEELGRSGAVGAADIADSVLRWAG